MTKRIKAFFRGMYEFRRTVTWADPAREGDFTDLDVAYDWGREWAHRLTFRKWDR